MSLTSQLKSASPVRSGGRKRSWPSRWTVAACALALLIAAPVVSVLINAFGARSGIRESLSRP